MGIDNVRKHPVWINMSPVKKRIMEEALEEGGKGKNNPEKGAAVIFKAMSELRNAGESFSKEETDVLVDELMKGMSAGDRAKVSMIRSMINNKA